MTIVKIRTIEELIDILENKDIINFKFSEAAKAIKSAAIATKYTDLEKLADVMVSSVVKQHPNTRKEINERNAYCAFALLGCMADYPAIEGLPTRYERAYAAIRLYSLNIMYGQAMAAVKRIFDKRGIDVLRILTINKQNPNLN